MAVAARRRILWRRLDRRPATKTIRLARRFIEGIFDRQPCLLKRLGATLFWDQDRALDDDHDPRERHR